MTTGLIGCDDVDDPPGLEQEATHAVDQSCRGSAAQLESILNGAADKDWFTYFISESEACGPGLPSLNFDLVTSAPLRLCVFIECTETELVEIYCGGSSQAAASPGGRGGCCNSSGEGIDLQMECVRVPENAQIFIRVDKARNNQCIDYSISYDHEQP